MPRFSANLGFLWPDLPLLERVAAAARGGFEAVEFHFPYDVPAGELREAATRAGVRILGINTAVAADHRGLGAVAGREAEFSALVEDALAYCQMAGGSSVHVMAGVVPDGDRAAAADVLVVNLRQAATRAADRDLTILLEALNPRDMPGYFYSRVEDVAEIIDRVAAPNVKLMFDVYHVGVGQGDILTRLRTYRDMIGHIQVAAVPSRAEPDEGEVAYDAIFAEIDRIGYDGWVGCEYRPRAGTDEGLGWLRTLGGSR